MGMYINARVANKDRRNYGGLKCNNNMTIATFYKFYKSELLYC